MAKETYAIVYVVVDGGGPAIEVIRGFKDKKLAKKAAKEIDDSIDGSESWTHRVTVIQET